MYIRVKNRGIGQLDPMPKTSAITPSQPITTGDSFASVSGGIASILSPFINAGVGIYLSGQQRRNQEKLLKAQQQQQIQTPVYLPQQQTSQNTILIVVGVAALVVLLVVLMGKKSGDTISQGISGQANSGQTVTKIVRRIKRPKR